MKRYLLSTCLAILLCSVIANAQTSLLTKAKKEALKKRATDHFDKDWLANAQAAITESGYYFLQQDNQYAVANFKHGSGFIINPAGFSMTPILYKDDPRDKNRWNLDMRLAYIGKGAESIFDEGDQQYSFRAERKMLSVDYRQFSVEYINNEEGLRQNFIVYEKPAGEERLSVLIQVEGDFTASSADDAIAFKDKDGNTRSYYRDLKVWDANDQLLEASMEINADGAISILVDDENAVYPVTIDPITQTAEWTGSADGILPTLIGQLAVDAAYGFSVAGLGDVNGDGYADVGIGAPAMVDLISGTGTLASVGAVFVYYGSANGLPLTPSAKLQPTTAVAGALFGYSIAGGDVNNDGRADIMVGAPLDNISISIGGGNTATGKVGKAYVFNGATLSTSTTPFLVLQLSGSGILENGVNLSVKALFGFSVAVTEDLNGDGKKDMIVGAPTYAGIKAGLLGNSILDVQSGGAFVYLTKAANNTITQVKLEPIKTSLLGLGLLESNINGLLYGYSVDGLGDYNNDGKADVVVTAPAGINASSISALLNGKILQGSALVHYGTGNSVNVNAGATLTATSGGLLTNLVGTLANVANLFGVSAKGVKNATGARNGNVIVGAPLGNDIINVLNLQLKTGTVSVFKKKLSSPSGYVVPDQVLTSPRNSNNILQIIQSNLLYGYSLDNILDVNCDGNGDIIIGEPVSSGVQLLNANVAGGAAYVYLGKADGTYQPAPAWTLTAYEDAFLGINATSLIGYSVAGAGAVRGSGSGNRILVGSPSRTLDFGSGLLNLGNTLGTIFSLVAGNNGVGKAFLFDARLCISLTLQKTDVLCAGGSTGTITAIFSDGVGPYSIRIDGGMYVAATSPTVFNNLSQGSHTVTVRDVNNTERSATIIINNPPPISTSVSSVNPSCPGSNNGSFNITASGGTGTLSYSKDGGQSFQSTGSFTGLTAGTYNWVVKDANNCIKTGQVILTDPAAITATATGTNPTFFGATNGSFIINASGGTGTLMYSKDGGQTYQASNNFTGLACGTYNWAVKDANGCIKTGQTTLACAPDITVTVTQNNPGCNGAATGSFTLNASGGTGTLMYSKDGGQTYQASNTFTGLAAGTYNWVVKDATGYTKTGQVILNNPPAILTTVTNVNPSCPGSNNGSFNITASGGTGTLSYSKDGGQNFQSTGSFTGLTAGTYNWVVKDANNCIKTGQVVLTDPAAITATATGTNPTFFGATNGSFIINASGGTGTLMYSKDGGQTYQASNNFTGLACGTYNWAVKDANGCIKTGQTTLACAPDITVTVTQNNPGCNGAATGSFTLNASGGTGTLTYSKDGGQTYQSSNTFTGLVAGTYNWVVKDATGYTKTGQVTLSNPPAILTNVTTVNPSCPGSNNGSFNITASGGTGTLSYSKDGGQNFQSNGSFTGLTAGTYNWVVKDANNCIKTGQVILTDPAAITATATGTNPSAVGVNDGTLTINASGGTGTLMYSKDGGQTYQASNNFTGLACGTYNWVVKDANGCTKTGQTILACACTPPAAPTVNVTQPGCTTSTGSIVISSPLGTGLTYSINGSTYQSSTSFANVVPGTYPVRVKNSEGCMSAATTVVINTQPATPAAPSVTVTQPSCTNSTGTITITAPLELSYSINGNTYQSSTSFSGLPAGTYPVTAKNSSGCISAATNVVLTAPTSCNSHIFHTGTTCSDYKNGGNGLELTNICYKVTGSKVGTVTPGVFFYYTKVIAPSANFCVNIEQYNNCGFRLFAIPNASQITLYNSSCTKIGTGTLSATVGYSSVCISNATVGQEFVISVKYDAKSIEGQTFTGAAPTCTYTFVSKINGSVVPNSTGTVTVAPNCSAGRMELVTGPEEQEELVPEESSKLFTLYPNPAQDYVMVNYHPEVAGKAVISLTTVDGRILASIPMEITKEGIPHQKRIDTRKIIPGIYMVRISNDKTTLIKKLIIAR